MKFQNWEHLFELSMPQLHKEEVRIFYHNLAISDYKLYLTSLVNEVNMGIDEDTLYEIFWAATKGIRSLRSENAFVKFLEICGILDGLYIKNVNKKTLKYQLLFQLMNKVLLPKSEKKTTTTGLDFFLMKVMFKY